MEPESMLEGANMFLPREILWIGPVRSVLFRDFGESSLDFELPAWIENPTQRIKAMPLRLCRRTGSKYK
jgi:hypothetical protein